MQKHIANVYKWRKNRTIRSFLKMAETDEGVSTELNLRTLVSALEEWVFVGDNYLRNRLRMLQVLILSVFYSFSLITL